MRKRYTKSQGMSLVNEFLGDFSTFIFIPRLWRHLLMLSSIFQVREKKQKLHDSEADLEKRHRESKERLEAQKRELEARVAAFEVRNNQFGIFER